MFLNVRGRSLSGFEKLFYLEWKVRAFFIFCFCRRRKYIDGAGVGNIGGSRCIVGAVDFLPCRSTLACVNNHSWDKQQQTRCRLFLINLGGKLSLDDWIDETYVNWQRRWFSDQSRGEAEWKQTIDWFIDIFALIFIDLIRIDRIALNALHW